jgi:hypothetical protein
MARPVTGACKVLEDPNRRGDEVALFWRSELLTDLVCLTLAPANANSQLRFEPRRWAGQQAALATSEGLHLILRLRHNAQHRLSYFRQLVVGKIGESVQMQWHEHRSSGSREAPSG